MPDIITTPQKIISEFIIYVTFIRGKKRDKMPIVVFADSKYDSPVTAITITAL